MDIQKFKEEQMNDEEKSWEQIQEIKNLFSPNIINSVRIKSKQEALEKATYTIQNTLRTMKDSGLDFKNTEPGHGPGHLIRDYVHSTLLFNNLEADAKNIFVGFVGGTLHDMGCSIIPRYDESTRAVRHAEVGALLTKKILDENSNLNDAEKISISHVIAAHTHYTKPSEIKCKDGETRIIEPYKDLDENGRPIYPVWFPRWVDRLDCNGAAFIGRHYLTLAEKHKDYDGIEHFEVDFPQHMQPLLRSFKEQVDEKGNRNQVMSEHMKMFADSQNNESPYGKHDYGFMVEMRDRAKERVYRIVESTQKNEILSPWEEESIREAWISFLSENVEPRIGNKTARTLDDMFEKLPEKTRHAWCNAFLTTMKEYKEYADEKLKQIEKTKMVYELPGIIIDVREVIKPNSYWVEKIKNIGR